jgi:mono/diheme cytochrome c family protein
MCYRALAAILALLMLGLIAAHAANADAAKGTQLARQWCANCHVVNNNPSGSVPQGPPTFAAIARSAE